MMMISCDHYRAELSDSNTPPSPDGDVSCVLGFKLVLGASSLFKSFRKEGEEAKESGQPTFWGLKLTHKTSSSTPLFVQDDRFQCWTRVMCCLQSPQEISACR